MSVRQKNILKNLNECATEEHFEKYREKKLETKQKVDLEKCSANVRWGQSFNRSYEENKKKF